LHNDTWLKIDVVDANDEIPLFIGLDENGRYAGSVAENLEPGAEVITVTATDRDEFPDFKKVYFCYCSKLRSYCIMKGRGRHVTCSMLLSLNIELKYRTTYRILLS